MSLQLLRRFARQANYDFDVAFRAEAVAPDLVAYSAAAACCAPGDFEEILRWITSRCRMAVVLGPSGGAKRGGT